MRSHLTRENYQPMALFEFTFVVRFVLPAQIEVVLGIRPLVPRYKHDKLS